MSVCVSLSEIERGGGAGRTPRPRGFSAGPEGHRAREKSLPPRGATGERRGHGALFFSLSQEQEKAPAGKRARRGAGPVVSTAGGQTHLAGQDTPPPRGSRKPVRRDRNSRRARKESRPPRASRERAAAGMQERWTLGGPRRGDEGAGRAGRTESSLRTRWPREGHAGAELERRQTPSGAGEEWMLGFRPGSG